MTRIRKREARTDQAPPGVGGGDGLVREVDAGADGAPDPRAVAAYVAALSVELLSLARTSDLPMLAYLIDMVRTEAEHQLSAEPPDATR